MVTVLLKDISNEDCKLLKFITLLVICPTLDVHMPAMLVSSH